MSDDNSEREDGSGNGESSQSETITPRLASMSGYNPPVEGQDDEWVPEHAIEALTMEKEMRPSETDEELAERIFQENLPVAAQAICHLAVNAGNAQVRFAAARYVVERRMGKLTDPANLNKGAQDIFKAFMGDVTVELDEQGMPVGVTTPQRRAD